MFAAFGVKPSELQQSLQGLFVHSLGCQCRTTEADTGCFLTRLGVFLSGTAAPFPVKGRLSLSATSGSTVDLASWEQGTDNNALKGSARRIGRLLPPCQSRLNGESLLSAHLLLLLAVFVC